MSAAAFKASRRHFLRGAWSEDAPGTRPPWALAERAFLDLCDRCDRCIDACPERLLGRGSGGYPEPDFERGGCTFCGDCAAACPTGALNRQSGVAWAHRARVADGCLSLNGIVCRACGDVCETQAIRFRLRTGGRAVPLVNDDECTGCGACRYACPVSAVSLRIPEEYQTPCPA